MIFRSHVILTFLVLLSICPVAVAAQETTNKEGDEKEESAWARVTQWLRPRNNPFRSTSSSIVVRNRRSLFVMPPVYQVQTEEKKVEGELSESEARRFMVMMEREFSKMKKQFDNKEYQLVIQTGKKLSEELVAKKIGPEHIMRRNDILREVKNFMNKAHDTLEETGIRDLESNVKKMESAFADKDYSGLRELGTKVESFVNGWEFRSNKNRERAQKLLQSGQDLVRRAQIREEFATLTIKVSFLVVTENARSTAVINDQPISEGEALDENLIVKKIYRDHILFIYKGEVVSYDIEAQGLQ